MNTPINLLEKPFFEELSNRIREFINNNSDSLTFEHPDFQVDQEITFLAGYNKDILYTSKIFAFNKQTLEAYIYWDCFWFPINLNERIQTI